MESRIIAKFEGNKDGPLLVAMACMHGNERTGVSAIKEVQDLLISEKNNNPDFYYNGTFLGLIGNIQAYQKNIRFINQDLNRMWEREYVFKILESSKNELSDENLEMYEIIETLKSIVINSSFSKLILIDLHTTSTDGAFSICTEDDHSIQIATKLQVPVVRGLLNGIEGTTLHYFNKNNLGIPATAVAFEAGKHTDLKAIDRIKFAIFNCMTTIGAINNINPHIVDNDLLVQESKNHPKIVKVSYKYTVKDNEQWSIIPGFSNFDEVKKGQLIAMDSTMEIYSEQDGMILMPLYQKKGNDGFFIVEKLQ